MKWKWLENVYIEEHIAMVGCGVRESIVKLCCPRCSAIQEQCMYFTETSAAIPKYCAYCGKKLVKESNSGDTRR